MSQLDGNEKLESLQSYIQTFMNSQKQMSNIVGDIDIRRYTRTENLDMYPTIAIQ